MRHRRQVAAGRALPPSTVESWPRCEYHGRPLAHGTQLGGESCPRCDSL